MMMSDDEDDEKSGNEGVLRVNLKGTKVETEERKGWLARIFLGKEKTVEVEDVTQMQYLEKIYEVFKEMGYENMLSLEINDKTVYADKENKDNDFQDAVTKAMEYESDEAYHIEFNLDTNGDEETNLNVNMYGQHKEGELPLTVRAYYEDKKASEIRELLEKVRDKINEKFGIESGEIEVEETESEDNEEESDDGDEESSEDESGEDNKEE